MPDTDFDAEYNKLIVGLDGAIALLQTYVKSHWADWLEQDRARIAAGDRDALDHLLSAFGGMGSFNDLVIHPVNGDAIEESDIDPVNKKLNAYRSEIWTAATAMRRDLDRE